MNHGKPLLYTICITSHMKTEALQGFIVAAMECPAPQILGQHRLNPSEATDIRRDSTIKKLEMPGQIPEMPLMALWLIRLIT